MNLTIPDKPTTRTRMLSGGLRAVVCAVICLMASCENGPRADHAGTGTAGEAGPAIEYEELARAHNERLDRYRTLNARGNIELRWRDDRGRHFEQGDLDFYLDQPRRTAFRVSKLGEIYFWAGSDDSCFWFFDLSRDQRHLVVESLDAEWMREGDQEDGVAFRPLTVLDLMALSRVPETASENENRPVAFDARRDAWHVVVNGLGGEVRLYFDRETRLPMRAESLNDRGEPVAQSTIRRYRAVDQPTGAGGGVIRPVMPTLVDIQPMDDSVGQMEVKIALGSPTAAVDETALRRVFDLARLAGSLRPQHIEGEGECRDRVDP